MYSSLYIPQTVFSDAPCFQRCPLWPRPGRAVSRRRGMQKRRQGPLGSGQTYVLQKSQGDASRRPRWGPASAPSMRPSGAVLSGVESTCAAHDTGRRTSGIISANLEGPLAVASYHPNAPCGPGLGAEGASWTSLKERPPGTIRGSDSSDHVGNCPLRGVSWGLCVCYNAAYGPCLGGYIGGSAQTESDADHAG